MPRHVHRFDELRQTRNSFKQEVIDYFRTHTQLETINHFRISESSLYRFAKEMGFKKVLYEKEKSEKEKSYIENS